jgi:hypothetical protein
MNDPDELHLIKCLGCDRYAMPHPEYGMFCQRCGDKWPKLMDAIEQLGGFQRAEADHAEG